MAVTEFNRKNIKAFTLVEILTVVTIVATLTAVLLPSLSRARQMAKKIYCLSNLRQMAIAGNSYGLANDNFFPIAHWSDSNKNYSWDFVVDMKTNKITPGLLWQGSSCDEINQCPSYKGSDNFAGIKYTGYNYNTSYLGHGQGETISSKYSGRTVPHPVWPDYFNIVLPAKIDTVKTPSNCAMFGDGQYSGGANKFMRSPKCWSGDRDFLIRKAGTQGFRHLLTTNIAWVDGHASSQKTIYTNSIPQVQQDIEKFNSTHKNIKIGFLSDDNSAYDLK